MPLLNNKQKLLFSLFSKRNQQMLMKDASEELSRSIQQISRLVKKLCSDGIVNKDKSGAYTIIKLTKKGIDKVESIASLFNRKKKKQEMSRSVLKDNFKTTLGFLEGYFPKEKIKSLVRDLLEDVELAIS